MSLLLKIVEAKVYQEENLISTSRIKFRGSNHKQKTQLFARAETLNNTLYPNHTWLCMHVTCWIKALQNIEQTKLNIPLWERYSLAASRVYLFKLLADFKKKETQTFAVSIVKSSFSQVSLHQDVYDQKSKSLPSLCTTKACYFHRELKQIRRISKL